MIHSNPAIVEHYDLLQSIGILDQLAEQSRKIQDLEDILVSASEIFTKNSIDAIVDYVKESLDDMFVPEDLYFFIRDGSARGEIVSFAYRKLKLTESSVKLRSLDPLEDFFATYPMTLGYSLFDYKFANEEIKQTLAAIPFELIVPIIGFSGLYGIVLFGKKMLGGDYSDIELNYIDKIMKFTSIAIQNTLHYQSSVRDLKTGLFNHSYFLSRLQEEEARSQRYNVVYSVLLLDIDNFKKFNDTYGHMVGDDVLVQTALVLKQTIRREDIVARFGGEEFVFLLPATDKYHAWAAAERIRKSIENMMIRSGDKTLSITVSIGGSCNHYGNRVNAMKILEQADESLYLSKKNGRNRSTLHNSGLLLKGKALHNSAVLS